jgi:hypothetical protein
LFAHLKDPGPDRLHRLSQLGKRDAEGRHQDNHVANRPREKPVAARGQTNLSPELAGRGTILAQFDAGNESTLPHLRNPGKLAQCLKFRPEALDFRSQ